MGVRALGTLINIQVLGDIRREHFPRPPRNGGALNYKYVLHDTGTNNNKTRLLELRKLDSVSAGDV